MTCAAAEPWVLAARTAAELPERVARHLARCPRCAARFDQLARVDVAAAHLVPSPNPEARARLDALLARASAPHAEPQLARPARRRAVPQWAVGLA
ncbi:MAG: anti-sigma factor, partial [Planctomycetes bacterium]|nr:anti-sigma factor [Planctomycetota bacterium]